MDTDETSFTSPLCMKVPSTFLRCTPSPSLPMSCSSEHHQPTTEGACPASLLKQCMSDGHYLVASGRSHTVPSQATQGSTEKSCCVDPMQKHCNGPIPLARTLGTRHSLTEMVGKHTVSSNKLLSPKEKWTASHGL